MQVRIDNDHVQVGPVSVALAHNHILALICRVAATLRGTTQAR